MTKDQFYKKYSFRKGQTLDNSFPIPNELIDLHLNLFKGKSFPIVLDLIRKAYKTGLEIGRNEPK